jgi:hypothetical protein
MILFCTATGIHHAEVGIPARAMQSMAISACLALLGALSFFLTIFAWSRDHLALGAIFLALAAVAALGIVWEDWL